MEKKERKKHTLIQVRDGTSVFFSLFSLDGIQSHDKFDILYYTIWQSKEKRHIEEKAKLTQECPRRVTMRRCCCFRRIRSCSRSLSFRRCGRRANLILVVRLVRWMEHCRVPGRIPWDAELELPIKKINQSMNSIQLNQSIN